MVSLFNDTLMWFNGLNLFNQVMIALLVLNMCVLSLGVSRAFVERYVENPLFGVVFYLLGFLIVFAAMIGFGSILFIISGFTVSWLIGLTGHTISIVDGLCFAYIPFVFLQIGWFL